MKAWCTVVDAKDFFQTVQTKKDLQMEEGLEQGNPEELCRQYITENVAKLSEDTSIEVIM